MKKFSDFLKENYFGVPVISVEKTKVNASTTSCINEINKNLSQTLSVGFTGVLEGFNKARETLEKYGILLPQTTFNDNIFGIKIIPVNQFGNVSGAKLNGEIDSPNKGENKLFFKFFYIKGNDGVYRCNGFLGYNDI